jgi:enolase
VRRYPIASIEDPLPEDKPKKWSFFFEEAQKINPQILIVADDLTVTDPTKIKRGAEKRLFNAVIIKPNQQGTITQAVKAVEVAKNLGIKTIVSHRGEETNDDWIVDFALSVNSDFVKFGAPSRGERIAKYNRLLQASRTTI